jgi:hypothetical protein
VSSAGDDTERAFGGTHTALGGGHAARSSAGSGEGAIVPASGQAEDQRLDGLMPLGISPLAIRGVGRPAGAKNRRTDLVASYLVERFGDPLTATMSVAGRSLRDLVTELRTVASDCGMKLGASVMDIARWQQQCRIDALPYMHAKRAPETVKGEVVVPIIGIGRFEQHNTTVNVGARSLEDALEKLQSDQSVTTIDGQVSHEEKSHDES